MQHTIYISHNSTIHRENRINKIHKEPLQTVRTSRDKIWSEGNTDAYLHMLRNKMDDLATQNVDFKNIFK